MNISNIITTLRIIGTICLLFTAPFSKEFFVIYSLCGVSDALDGFIARKTNTASEFGAKLDSIADLVFYAVILYIIFPVLWYKLPSVIWYIVGFIVIVRLCAYTVSAIKYRGFAPLHKYLNKLTGFAVLVIPYIIHCSFAVLICFAVCIIATAAAVEELLIHIGSRS